MSVGGWELFKKSLFVFLGANIEVKRIIIRIFVSLSVSLLPHQSKSGGFILKKSLKRTLCIYIKTN